MVKIGHIWTSFGISFLQIGASLEKTCGSQGGRVTFVCETIYAAPPPLIFYRGNIELYECHAKTWNYYGFIWPFLYINCFLGI